MGKYPTTNITYSGIEDKGGPTVTIKDENGNKWTIWKNDYEFKDTLSEAYASFQNYKIGETFGVEYGEKEESFTGKEGNLVNFTRRTIYKILPLVANPTSPTAKTSAPRETGHQGANNASGGPSEDFWEKKAYKQCLWGFFLESKGGLQLSQSDMDLVWDIFKAIEADADKRFSPLSEPRANEAAPGILEMASNMADEDLGEDIPFR